MFECSGNMAARAVTLLTLLFSGANVASLNLREPMDGHVVTPSRVLSIGRSSSFTVSKPSNNVKGMATSNGDRHLQLHGVEVPVYKCRGEDAQLECKYDRGNDPLYSVKWYKDDDEFYRYVFRQNIPKQTFPVSGVFVDMQRSNERRVLLRELSFNSTGVYRCEVSADSPSFHTFSNQSVMVIVELPAKGPTITGGRKRYRVGETAKLNCTSSRSKPAASLTWFINNEEAEPEHLVSYYPWIHEDGLESRRLGLQFIVSKDHFLKDELVLKCQATVAAIHTATEEEDATVYVSEPVILEQREELIKARSGATAALPTSRTLQMLLAILVGVQAVT